jgi:hypothetical protein
MKKIVFSLLVGGLMAFWACKSDPINCTDDKVGNVFFDKKAKDFCPLDGTEKLIFENVTGDEITLTCPAPRMLRVPVNAEKLCDGTDLRTHYSYYEGDVLVLRFSTADQAYNLEFQLVTTNPEVKNLQDTALIDVFSAVFFRYNTGASVSLIASDRGNGTRISDVIKADYTFGRFVGDTTLNGRALTDVWIGKIFDQTPVGEKTQVFAKSGSPVIGFSDAEGNIWLLDRVE